jgi:uncharacterized membrane protein
MAEVTMWERDALVDGETAGRIRQRYAGSLGSGRNLALTAFGLLGALLVGAGILLLLAHNWADLPRAVRTGLAILPMVVAQGLAVAGLLKGREGAGWREGVGLFWFLTIGGAVAMVSQVYHLPGSFDRFLLTWCLLALPALLVLRSSVAAVFYLAAAAAWAIDRMDHGNQELWYWALLAGALPLCWSNFRHQRFSVASALLGWAMAVALSVGTAITLVRAVPGLWVIIFSAWSAIFLLLDQRYFRAAPSAGHRPFLYFGVLGALVMTLVLTYEMPWREIGWHHYHARDEVWRQVLDPVLALVLAGAAVTLLMLERRHLKPSRIALALLPVLSIAVYTLSAAARQHGWAMLVFNLYALAVGLLLLVDGFRHVKGSDVNAGLLAIGALVVLRFFDGDQNILVRGVVFVLLGVAFLVVNLVLARKKARSV